MSLKVVDKRSEFVEAISLENTRVDLSSPLIFLCGGNVDVAGDEFGSVRNALMGHFASARCGLFDSLVLAEQFKDWLSDAVYHDLLVFEDDIAAMSSLVVVILESAGALTELGLFSMSERLKKKLLVFVAEKHFDQQSFIVLGPLRHLEKLRPGCVCSYPWDDSDLRSTLAEYLPDIRRDILYWVDVMDASESFDASNRGHLAFLAYELVRVFRALKFSEVEGFFAALEIKVSKDDLRKIFFLLDKFNLVRSKRLGHQPFYYAVSDKKRVRFGGHFDEARAFTSAMQFYAMTDSERHRFNVIKSVYPSGGAKPGAEGGVVGGWQ